MNIKVCGMLTIPTLLQLEKLGVDYIGLSFIPDSHQYIRSHLTSQQMQDADLDIKKVGIFCNATMDEIEAAIEEYELDLVQCIGEESVDFCKSIADQIELIKSFDVQKYAVSELAKQIVKYDEACDYYCFDYYEQDAQEVSFDWKNIASIKVEKPFFIGSKLLTSSHLNKVHAFKHPDFLGVDIQCELSNKSTVEDTAQVFSIVRSLQQVNN